MWSKQTSKAGVGRQQSKEFSPNEASEIECCQVLGASLKDVEVALVSGEYQCCSLSVWLDQCSSSQIHMIRHFLHVQNEENTFGQTMSVHFQVEEVFNVLSPMTDIVIGFSRRIYVFGSVLLWMTFWKPNASTNESLESLSSSIWPNTQVKRTKANIPESTYINYN